MKHPLLALALLGASAPCLGQDPIKTDGDKYKVVLDNACVRVLEYHDQSGQITHQHHHPAFVLYAVTPFERAIHLADATIINRSFKAGDVIWSPAQIHIGENVGSTPTHALIVESKPSGRALSKCSDE